MNILKLNKSSYRVREMYKGKTYSKYYSHKPTQREAQTDMIALIEKDNISSKEKFKTCIDTYIESKRNILSPASIKRYKTYIKNIPPKLLNTCITDINTIQLQSAINEYVKTHNPKSTKDYYGFIKSVLNVYTERKYKIILPPIIKRQQYIPTKQEINNILEVAKNTKYEIPILLATYGMRIGEIMALELNDIECGKIHITKTITYDEHNTKIIKAPKTIESNRILQVPSYITDLIQQKREIYNSSANAINRFLFRTERRLGIKKFSIHKLRHFFASELHYRNIPSKYIQAMGGWATDNVMKSIYIHTNKPVEMINILE